MPEIVNEKNRPEVRVEHREEAGVEYAELAVTSNFSFLRGGSHPEELVARGAELGCKAVAITDLNSLAGIVRGHKAAEEAKVGFVVGCRVVVNDESRMTNDESNSNHERSNDQNVQRAFRHLNLEHSDLIRHSTFVIRHLELLVYPTSRTAYGRLCTMLTRGKRRVKKGQCNLTWEDVVTHQEGLLAIVLPPRFVGGADGEKFRDMVREVKKVFGERLSLAASCLYDGEDARRLAQLAEIAKTTGVPLVATNDVHYHLAERKALQDVLTCIRLGCTLAEAGFALFANAERHMKGPAEMARLFAEYPAAIRRTVEIADRAMKFSLNEIKYEYPDEICPPGRTLMEHLVDRTWEGARERYSSNDEIRMTNHQSNSNDECPNDQNVPGGAFRHSNLDHSDLNRHSSFVIRHSNLTHPDHPANAHIPDNIKNRLAHEFALIAELNYPAYFLTVDDIVRFARSRGILCQGRGAAANSAVCYCLGITAVDPNKIDLLVERFISKERDEPPDIDIDFEHERREEVIQYLYQKYGRDRAALVAEVISYRRRSAVREVGKALGLSLDCVDRLAKSGDWWENEVINEERLRALGLDPADVTLRRLMKLASELIGFPRHLSQHVGGFVFSRGPLCESAPIENASMPDRTIVEWDKDDIDAMGMLKVDCLGLGMLTCIRKALDLVNEWDRNDEIRMTNDESNPNDECSNDQNVSPQTFRHSNFEPLNLNRHSRPLINPYSPGFSRDLPRFHSISHVVSSCRRAVVVNQWSHSSFVIRHSKPLQLHTIPPEDPAVYDMLCNADSIGVFQVESRAQMTMLPRLRPRCYYDLVIEVAIVRPGPIQGGMIHPYLRRRNGEEPITYPNDAIKQVLGRTLGVPLFQEQAMRLVMVAAGFSAGEADQLRRAMAAWKRKGDQIERFGQKIVAGMTARGYTTAYALRVVEQIKGFSEYGFPESHAASFALVVYVSAWLKRHKPAAFAAALINSQPMGFYQPAQIVRDAKDHGVDVRPVDVNWSGWDCRLENTKQEWPRMNTDEHGCKKENKNNIRVHPCLSVANSSPSLRLGMRLIGGIREEEAKKIEQAVVRHGHFTSIAGLWRSSEVRVATLKLLAGADAFTSMGLDRQQALWVVGKLRDEKLPMFEGLEDFDEGGVALPEISVQRRVVHDYAATGLSLKAHPISFVRERLARLKVIQAADLASETLCPNGRRLAVGGIILVRQRPSTAAGVLFITLEDETGIANLVVRPAIYDQFRGTLRTSVCVIAWGKVERQGQVVHILVERAEDLAKATGRETEITSASRDFH